MVATLKVLANAQGPSLFETNFASKKELEDSVPGFSDNKRVVKGIEALFIPVKATSFTDVFVPFSSRILDIKVAKAHNIALKLFIFVISVLVDLWTLNIRFITLIPKAIYNYFYSKETHLFYQYLISKGLSPEILGDSIYVEIEEVTPLIDKGVRVEQHQYKKVQFNFVPVGHPKTEKCEKLWTVPSRSSSNNIMKGVWNRLYGGRVH